MQTTIKVKSALNTEVKNIHSLLQQLSIEDRIDYVKGMIPSLLPLPPKQATSSGQRLSEKRMTPFNNLSPAQCELIADLTLKTEALHRLKNEEN